VRFAGSGEAMAEDNGKLAMIDQLTEVFLIQLPRYTMQARETETGMLSGLAHTQLVKAIKAIHAAPEQNRSLESLANLASIIALFMTLIPKTPAISI
tara:strand:+ start:4110 stop:4400 length:291 start_codon:yes stop_codon:yes gene_type:complete